MKTDLIQVKAYIFVPDSENQLNYWTKKRLVNVTYSDEKDLESKLTAFICETDDNESFSITSPKESEIMELKYTIVPSIPSVQ